MYQKWIGLGVCLALVALGGCSEDLGLDARTFACETDEDCGDGFICVDSSAGAICVEEASSEVCGDEVCLVAESCCNDLCVDTDINRSNCGACGNACPSGQVCNDGSCEIFSCTTNGDCESSELCCGGLCVDPLEDPSHCGQCDNSCGSQACIGGVCEGCVPSCSSSQSCCEDSCVDTGSDDQNCGACGTACGEGEICQGGSCQRDLTCADEGDCEDGELCCGDVCIDTSTSNTHCGACDNACSTPDFACQSGACELIGDPCEAGFLDCDADTVCESDPTDVESCGVCGTTCTACTNGDCICGGAPCGVNTSCCFDGVDSFCADLEGDRFNCGACGTTCELGQACNGGSCVPASPCEVISTFPETELWTGPETIFVEYDCTVDVSTLTVLIRGEREPVVDSDVTVSGNMIEITPVPTVLGGRITVLTRGYSEEGAPLEPYALRYGLSGNPVDSVQFAYARDTPFIDARQVRYPETDISEVIGLDLRSDATNAPPAPGAYLYIGPVEDPWASVDGAPPANASLGEGVSEITASPTAGGVDLVVSSSQGLTTVPRDGSDTSNILDGTDLINDHAVGELVYASDTPDFDEIVVASDNGIYLITWSNDGARSAAELIIDLPEVIQVDVVDANRDGHLDIIAVYDRGENTLAVLLNNEDGTFSEPTTLGIGVPGENPNGADLEILGALRGDTAIFAYVSGDIIRIEAAEAGLSLTHVNTVIPFSPIFGAENVVWDAAVSDIDGDEYPDIAQIYSAPLASSGPTYGRTMAVVQRGMDGGQFLLVEPDADGDGVPDLGLLPLINTDFPFDLGDGAIPARPSINIIDVDDDFNLDLVAGGEFWRSSASIERPSIGLAPESFYMGSLVTISGVSAAEILLSRPFGQVATPPGLSFQPPINTGARLSIGVTRNPLEGVQDGPLPRTIRTWGGTGKDPMRQFQYPAFGQLHSGLAFLIDIEQDGDLDVMATEAGGVNVYYNSGGTTPTFESGFFAADNASGIPVVADFDGNGVNDVAYPGNLGNAFGSVYLGSDDAVSFREVNLPKGLGGPIRDLAAGDLDADGDIDLVATSASALDIFFNDGQGRFVLSNQESSYTGLASNPVILDLTSDGIPDIFFTVGNQQRILQGVGNGLFNMRTATSARTFEWVDVARFGPNVGSKLWLIGVELNETTGGRLTYACEWQDTFGFGGCTSVQPPITQNFIVSDIGDFNGDEKLDLVGVTQSFRELLVITSDLTDATSPWRVLVNFRDADGATYGPFEQQFGDVNQDGLADIMTGSKPTILFGGTPTSGNSSFCYDSWGDCDGTITNGCETNLRVDSNNCGSCGTSCNSGQVCNNGACN